MAISAWFYHQLQAMQDRGLNPTFDDVLVGLAKAREGGSETPSHLGTIDEQEALQRIEEVTRKRQAKNALMWDALKALAPSLSGFGDVLRDERGEPVQCQNRGP